MKLIEVKNCVYLWFVNICGLFRLSGVFQEMLGVTVLF